MHQEAGEELRVRPKLAVLDLAQYLGVANACREFNVPRSSFPVGNRDTRKKDDWDCIEKDPSPIATRAGHPLKWWRRS